MVNSIQGSDNKKSNFSQFPTSTVVVVPPSVPTAINTPPSTIVKQMPVDTVAVSNKQKKQINSNNALLTAFLLTGVVSSAVLAGSMIISAISRRKGQYKGLIENIKKSHMPDYVKVKLFQEIEKLKRSIFESDISQNYINNIMKLNWDKPQPKLYDIEKAKKILDEDHLGLAKVKEEIISFLKAQNHNTKNNVPRKGPLILCLDGPPGVGKTSIAESIAKAMDKKFERISLAGVSHKSFVKGAERLYKGAEPGQIIKSLQKSGTSDPVILIDEIDKMGHSTEHGDPAFALLDALEPKQCSNFTDENLEIPYDLSNVTFIITSNDLNRIPEVLKDRLSIIKIPPYTRQEKIDICNFNIKKMLETEKINSSLVQFARDGIEEIINNAQDLGARRTIDNTTSVFNKIKDYLQTHGYENQVVVNKDFVRWALQNKQ